MSISRKGDFFVWTYERLAGVKSERWGDKVPAAAEGIVTKIDDCRALLEGQYTRFEGSGQRGRSPIGSPMEWRFRSASPNEVLSEGLGYGRESFRIRWQKDASM
ncbi:MAG: hypothetical protein EXQ85_10015 [Alphaproteobacteria bacterium]|nr:hypothetical protein [Alphaproteobacteria bacterium]